MGDVYLATDVALDRPVALKFLAPRIARDPDLRARFLREARAQARIQHPNVCHIYYIGEQDGQLFFAMEYIEGETLQTRLDQGGKLPAGEALEVCRMAALGLREASRHGFTHRDVKPSNLMVDRHGVVKVLDFGIVKQDHEERAGDVGLTAEKGILLGTPLYMAPEQAKGEKIDLRADVYALGATLHHLVAGKPPFEADTTLGVVAKHLSEPRPRLAPRRRRGPSAIDLLCDRMMAKRPEDRFAAYDDLIAALERLSPRITRPAGVVVRGCALAIDFAAISLLTIPFERFVSFAVPWLPIIAVAYSIVAHGRWGRTLGKAMLEIEVVPANRAGRIGMALAARRFLLQWGMTYVFGGAGLVLELTLGYWGAIGYLLAALPPPVFGLFAGATEGKRAWWDVHAGTQVRYRQKGPSA